MRLEPHPSTMTLVQWSPLARSPVTVIGVMNTVHTISDSVVEVDVLSIVIQRAGPVPHHVGGRRVFRKKGIQVCRDHQKTAWADRGVGESEVNPGGETPASHVHGRGALVV